MMNMVSQDSVYTVFEGDGKRVVITRNEYNNSGTPKYNVFVKEGTKRGKTVATRCNWETAIQFTQ